MREASFKGIAIVAVTVAAAAAMVLAAPRQAQACSCIRPPGPKESLAQAHQVFEGTVERVTATGNKMVARFAIARAWKGVSSQQIEVHTAASSAACGLGFQKGARWLIYAREVEGAVHAGLCSRSTQSDNAAADIAALGTPTFAPGGSAPSPSLSPSPSPGPGPAPEPAEDPLPSPTHTGADAEPPGAAPLPEPDQPPAQEPSGGCGSCRLTPGASPAPSKSGRAALWLVAAAAARRRQRRRRLTTTRRPTC